MFSQDRERQRAARTRTPPTGDEPVSLCERSERRAGESSPLPVVWNPFPGMFSRAYDRQYQALFHLSSEQYPPRGGVQIRNLGIQKALGALGFRDSLSFERAKLSRDDERRVASFEPRSSVALLPAVLVSSRFAESASPFQSARIRLVGPAETDRLAHAYLNTARHAAVFT